MAGLADVELSQVVSLAWELGFGVDGLMPMRELSQVVLWDWELGAGVDSVSVISVYWCRAAFLRVVI